MKVVCPHCNEEFDVSNVNAPSTALGEARRAKGLSLARVSTATGLSIRAIGRLERGVGQPPRLSDARKIAELYGSTIDELWPSGEDAVDESSVEDDDDEVEEV